MTDDTRKFEVFGMNMSHEKWVSIASREAPFVVTKKGTWWKSEEGEYHLSDEDTLFLNRVFDETMKCNKYKSVKLVEWVVDGDGYNFWYEENVIRTVDITAPQTQKDKKLVLHLRDRNQKLVDCWNFVFENVENVNISCGDIFDNGDHMKVDAIISPANSFGFMDGGIDYVYSEFFGWQMQEHLQKLIWDNHQGELLVGQACVLDIRKSNPSTVIPYLISAPTMRIPTNVSNTVNAYLAFIAALRVADSHPEINSVLCPGLGTAIGQMPYENCAMQMHEAWNRYNNPKDFGALGLAHSDHHAMMNKSLYSRFNNA